MRRLAIALIAFTGTTGAIFLFNRPRADQPIAQATFSDEPTLTSQVTSSDTPLPSLAPTLTAKVIISKTPAPTPKPEYITLNSPLPLTFAVKKDALLSITTLPGTQCSIKVILPSGSTSGAKGLETKTTDGPGLISWTWNISWNSKPGNGKINLSCSKDSLSFSKSLIFTITN